jgi:hypothetical protein
MIETACLYLAYGFRFDFWVYINEFIYFILGLFNFLLRP